MIFNSMLWHNAAILGESALEASGRVVDIKHRVQGENRSSPPTPAALFDKHLKLKDVTATTEPNQKTKLRIRWICVQAFDTSERLQLARI
jgi:hypothetical protein